jgi:hypothetical protein
VSSTKKPEVHSSPINIHVHLSPQKQQSDSTSDEPPLLNEIQHEASLDTHQIIDNNNDQIEINSINQEHSGDASSVNEQEPIDDQAMLTEQIEDLQLKDPSDTVRHNLDETRHYTSYFYNQTDFEDYNNSMMAPRAPVLFNGKRFLS